MWPARPTRCRFGLPTAAKCRPRPRWCPSIGSWVKRDIALDDASVSRRHALIANFPNDVWLYDLGSTRGIQVDGEAVPGRAFLDGVHRVMVGRIEVEVGAPADLLV